MNNFPIVDVGTFVDIVETQFNEGNYRPIFGLGKGGIGKSQGIRELASKLGIGYIDIRLLLYTETDLKGIPYPDSTNTYTIWLQNNILPNEQRDGKWGILVLDEITSCNKSLRTAAYQLLNERKLGEYSLPDEWLIVCLGNGEEDGGDFQGIEANFANRCSIYQVYCSVDSWKEWAALNGVNGLVLAYLTWNPSDLHTFNPDADEEVLFASPRSWNAVSEILNKRGFDVNDNITQLRISANVGVNVASRFKAFCEFKSTALNPESIINGTWSGKCQSLQAQFITVQNVIKLLKESLNYDIGSRGHVSNETILKFANGIKWFLSLGSLEHQVAAIKDLVNVNPRIISYMMVSNDSGFQEMCPEIIKFASEHADVFR